MSPPDTNLPLMAGYLALALVPGLVWLGIFYRKDRFEPEPKRLVALSFILGCVLVPVAGRLEPWIVGELGRLGLSGVGLRVLEIVLAVALVEEGLKAAALYLGFFHHPEFNEPMDGIVYGSSVGIGFATAENVLYMMRSDPGAVLGRMVVSTVLHTACTALFGYALGRMKFGRSGRGFTWRTAGAVVVLHSLYDLLIVGAPAASRWLGPLVPLVLVLLLVFGMLQYLDLGVDEALARSPFRPRRRRAARTRDETP